MGNKILVIVESPAKCKAIKKYLEKAFPQHTFDVQASFGHVRDLDKKTLGVDVDNFEIYNTKPVHYIVSDAKKEALDKLTKLARGVDYVVLASDNDREGEAIAWHLKEHMKLKGYKRMIFNEITETAIRDAFCKLTSIDMDLVNAQQARRIIDRVVGFKISPLLWGVFKVEYGGTVLSAGRVQSATLKYIIEKEKEIENFKSSAYWTCKADFALTAKELIEDCKLYNNNTNNMERFESLAGVRDFLSKLKDDFHVTGSRLHDSKQSPDAPFITSTLQQEAANKLGFSVKMTMATAQGLYEKGYITYMRTDSYVLSAQAMAAAKTHIVNKYGAQNYEAREHNTKRKVKNGQGAHEAIRPTDFARDSIPGVDDAAQKLYSLIHKRTVASQMKAAIYRVLDIQIQDTSMMKKKAKYSYCEFRGKYQLIKDPGYLLVYGEKAQDLTWLENLSKNIDNKVVTAKEIIAKNTWASAPSRYNEAGLVKVLERDGIGRPSTYGAILEKLYQKNYVSVQNTEGVKHNNIDLVWKKGAMSEVKYESISNAEMNRLVPTEIGKRIHAFMTEHFPDIINIEFTANMEEKLDDIAEGKLSWVKVLTDFWKKLGPRVAEVSKLSVRHKDREVLELQKQEYIINGETYVVRLGKYGPLIEKVVAKGTTKEFLGLKPYLKLVKKAYTELTAEEVKMLTSLPINIGSPKAALKYGRYGFYVVIDGENFMLPQKWVKQEFGGWKHINLIEPKHLKTIQQMKKDYLAKKAAGDKVAKSKGNKTEKPMETKAKKPAKKVPKAFQKTKA